MTEVKNLTAEDRKVRKLPNNWKWKRLDKVCQINPRRPRLSRDSNALTSFLPMSNVDEVEGVITKLEIRPYKEVARGFTYFEEWDVLFAKITPSMENGKCAIAYGLIDKIGFGSTEFHVLRPSAEIRAEWVHKYLRRLSLRLEAKQHFRGAVGQQRVPSEFLESCLVPVPPTLDMQKQIVCRIDSLLGELKSDHQLLDKMRRDTSRFLEMKLEEIFENLQSVRQPLIDVIESPPRNGWSPKCDDNPNGTPVLKLGAVLRFQYNPDEFKRTSLPTDPNAHYWLKPGDVLISRSNTLELVGHAAIYSGTPFPCIYPDLMMRIRVDQSKADSRFLVYWLQSKEVRHFIQSRASGASPTMKKINQGHVCNIPFPGISVEKQRQLAHYLDSIQSEVNEMLKTMQQDAKLLERLEQTILEKAFQGQL